MDLDLARQQWEDGNRRIEAARADPGRYRRLSAQVDVVIAGLRKRVGQIFTLDELAGAYDGADEWARDAARRRRPGGERRATSPAPSRMRRSTPTPAGRRTTARDDPPRDPPPRGICAGLLLAFVVGMAFGQALGDDSTPVRDADARPHAAAAAAGAGGPRNGHGHGSEPVIV